MTTTTKTLHGWDTQSGVRERLALLAAIGPTLTPNHWGYHTRRDYWYACGPDRSSRTIIVSHEGTASLAIIERQYQIGRAAALTLIGYPDSFERLPHPML